MDHRTAPDFRPAAPRRVRIPRPEGARRALLPLIHRLSHERRVALDPAIEIPRTRPRPSVN